MSGRGARPSRRAVLRGLGTLLALPLLESILPRDTRADPSPPPLRTLFFYLPNGLLMNRFRPIGSGTSFSLPAYLAPLEPFRDRLLFLTGLHNRVAVQAENEPHSNCTGSLLTGVRLSTNHKSSTQPATSNGASADQLLAGAIGGATRLPSLVLSSEGSWYPCGDATCAYAWNVSWSGPTTPSPHDVNLQSVFDRLFGGDDPAESAAASARRIATKGSVLDAVLEDGSRIRPKLGRSDAQRLDEYLDGVRALETKLTAMTTACPAAHDPAFLAAFPMGAAAFPDHVHAMCDLMTLAFQCDQTRIATYMLGFGSSGRSYPQLGVKDGHHWLSHHGGDPGKLASLALIEAWELEQFAYLLGRLASVPESGGTLLDHCQVVLCNEMGNGDTHEPWDLPVIVAGKANGAITTGRVVHFPDEAPFANLLISLLGNAGLSIPSLGEAGTGKLPGLTA